MESLPNETLEQIFKDVDYIDLLNTASLKISPSKDVAIKIIIDNFKFFIQELRENYYTEEDIIIILENDIIPLTSPQDIFNKVNIEIMIEQQLPSVGFFLLKHTQLEELTRKKLISDLSILYYENAIEEVTYYDSPLIPINVMIDLLNILEELNYSDKIPLIISKIQILEEEASHLLEIRKTSYNTENNLWDQAHDKVEEAYNMIEEELNLFY